MSKGTVDNRTFGERMVDRLGRRVVPIVVSVVFIALGLAYDFRWGSVVRHIPSLWISPGDLSTIYGASISLAHGHLAAIYQNRPTLREFPGILLALAPISVFGHAFHTTFAEIARNHHLVTRPTYLISNTTTVWDSGTVFSGAHRSIEYSVQPQWFVFLAPYVSVLSCTALFALDALAERLQVSRARRGVLILAEATILWPVPVLWGHPEDAFAVALGVYALLFAMEQRWTSAGWLFGAAVAVQPLVVVMFPIFLAMGGKQRALGLVLRTLIPGLALTVPPLAANLHAAGHDLVTPPAYPDVSGTRQTPFTALAPKVGGSGTNVTIAGGPLRRVPTVGLAVALWFLVRRWRDRPEMIVWAAALALSLRSYTELVMTPYYMWPALAVALVVAARGGARRFAIAVALAVAVTVVAQWRLGVFLWWGLVIGGLTALLVVAAKPGPPVAVAVGAAPGRAPTSTRTQRRAGTPPRGKSTRKSSRTNRSRAGRR